MKGGGQQFEIIEFIVINEICFNPPANHACKQLRLVAVNVC
jgi:hypothetical protein